MTDSATNTGQITTLISAVAEIKGILNTRVVTQAEDIRDLKQNHGTLRYDLDRVKENAAKDTTDAKAEMVDRINVVAAIGAANTNAIVDIRSDVTKVEDKQNATFGKVVQVLSPIVAVLALIWAVLGGNP